MMTPFTFEHDVFRRAFSGDEGLGRLRRTRVVMQVALSPMLLTEGGARRASAKVTFDRVLLNELMFLRFLDSHAHVAIVGPVGVGKRFSPTPSGTSLVAAAPMCSPCAPNRCSRR
jgi:hypothetical protein